MPAREASWGIDKNALHYHTAPGGSTLRKGPAPPGGMVLPTAASRIQNSEPRIQKKTNESLENHANAMIRILNSEF